MPHQRATRGRLSCAAGCAGGRKVESAGRHDLPCTSLRRPRRWLVPDLAHVHTDTYHGRFVKLVPNQQTVEVDEFETKDPALCGEMTITITLTDSDGGTDLLALHDRLPPAVSPADNEAGWQMALAKLAALVETGS